MSTLTLLGWVAIHALWESTLIGGLAALAFGLLRRARPEQRDRAGMMSLVAMAIVPVATALLKPDPMPSLLRRPALMTIDSVIPMPAYLEWRSLLVPIVGALWAVGVGVCLIRLAVAWHRAGMLTTRDTARVDADVQADVAGLRRRLAISTVVEVRRSASARVPMVLGSRRPLILLPERALAVLRADERHSILAHELAHVRRHDYLTNVLQLLAESLMFFHPAARWVSRRIRVEREYCCDDLAIAASGDRATYARALFALDDARSHCALAVAAVSGTLLDRIERIAGRPRRLLGVGRGAALMIAATVAAVTLVVATLALPQDVPPGARLRTARPPAGAMTPSAGASSLPRRPSR